MLTLLQEKKTGALFETAVLLGCLAAGVPEDSDKARFAKDYAKHIGLAFQITDDLLDECGDAALFGEKHRQRQTKRKNHVCLASRH